LAVNLDIPQSVGFLISFIVKTTWFGQSKRCEELIMA
jgi:hypothetical protein